MKIRVPDYFKDFKCIASECEDTCCAGWEIVIDNDSYKKYQSLKGEFGERLRSSIVNDGEDDIFKLKGRDCSFLNKEKLCDIYNELGEDGLCYTCKQYPRFTEEFGNLREVGISLSCPEAARLILRDDKKVEFLLSEVEEEVTSYNDIDGMLFIYLLQCRKLILNTLQNRKLRLEDRLVSALIFTGEIQKKIDDGKIQDLKELKEMYSEESNIASNRKFKDDSYVKYDSIFEILKVFKNLKHINDNDPLGLEEVSKYLQEYDDNESYVENHKKLDEYYKDSMYKLEKLVVYFVYRYYMKGVFDFDVLAKMKIAIVSFIMVKELLLNKWNKNDVLSDKDSVDIMQMYSKDVEHLEENIETLSTLFETNDVFKQENLLKILKK